MLSRVSMFRMLAGIVLLVVLVAAFGWRPIAENIAGIPLFWLIGALALIVAATLISACNRFLLINIDQQVTLQQFLPVYWVAWATGLLVPGQVGDVATLAALMRRRGMQVHQSLGRSLLDKMISFCIVGAFGSAGIAMQLQQLELSKRSLNGPLQVAMLVLVATLFAAWAVPQSRQRLADLMGRLKRLMTESMIECRRTATAHPGRVMLNVLLSVLSFLMLGASYWCMFRGLGYESISLAATIPVVAACSLIAYLPISFNGIGTAEAGGVLLFGLAGVGAAAVISAFICLRLLVYAVAWIPAAAILLSSSAVERSESVK